MNKKYLGIDWGTKRIGLAIAESASKTAVPHSTASTLKEVIQVISEEDIDEVIIGTPVKMSGDTKNLTPEYNKFFKELDQATLLPVITVDERLTSRAADALPGEKKDKASRDEIAAMLILQSYLDSSN